MPSYSTFATHSGQWERNQHHDSHIPYPTHLLGEGVVVMLIRSRRPRPRHTSLLFVTVFPLDLWY